MEIKTNQQVRAESYPFPPDEHQHVVVRKNQSQHGKHEEVEVPEEAVIAALMRHVSGGINVDEQADTCNEEKPNGGKGIEEEPDFSLEFRRRTVEMTRERHVAIAPA